MKGDPLMQSKIFQKSLIVSKKVKNIKIATGGSLVCFGGSGRVLIFFALDELLRFLVF